MKKIKFLIKRNDSFIEIDENIGQNWSTYAMVNDFEKATLFETYEEANDVVKKIMKEHKRLIDAFGEPIIVEVE